MNVWRKVWWLPLLFGAWVPWLQAQEVKFTVVVERTVIADQSVAWLRAQHTSSVLSEASLGVNQDVAWVKEQLSEYPQLQLENLEYRSWSYPNRHGETEGSIEWQVQQDLLVRGEDRTLMAEVVGSLQQRVALTGFGVELSPALKLKVSDELTDEALLRVRERAQRIEQGLGFGDYLLSSIDIEDNEPASGAGAGLLKTRLVDGDILENYGPEPGKGEAKVGVTVRVRVILRNKS